MNSNKKTGRITGVLLILVFVIGVSIYQFLRGPTVFADDFLVETSINSNQIIVSILLALVGGLLSIIISIVLFPIFKKYSLHLAYLYIAFCIVNFLAISIENYSVLTLLELSNEYVNTKSENSILLEQLGTVFYENHKWAHYVYLLISCIPVFVFYYTLLISKLVPKVLSIFGIFAVVLMGIEIVFSIFGASIHTNLLIPIGLIQLIFPIWLIIKGLNTPISGQN